MKAKSKAAIVVIICVLFIAYNVLNAKFKLIIPNDRFAFSPIPENGQIGGIEGVYYHRASSPIEILDELSCKTESWDNCTLYHFLRFYDDGIVLSTPIGSDNVIIQKEDFPNLEWFNRDTEEMSHGKYFISGNRIWFSSTIYYSVDNTTVTVDYSGIILGNTLLLNEYSHFNGNKLRNVIYVKANSGE